MGACNLALLVAARHADNPRRAVIATVSLGGDNVHRAAVVAALLACAGVVSEWPVEWAHSLAAGPVLEALRPSFTSPLAHAELAASSGGADGSGRSLSLAPRLVAERSRQGTLRLACRPGAPLRPVARDADGVLLVSEASGMDGAALDDASDAPWDNEGALLARLLAEGRRKTGLALPADTQACAS